VGSKNKLKRFKENEKFHNVFQPDRSVLLEDSFPLKGKWNENFFKNKNPIILELACGKGEYTLYLASVNTNINHIGVDIKGARFWRGAKTAVEKKIKNVAFLRAQIELIDSCFSNNEIDEIWITFPDPQIKFKKTNHRLTNPFFLKKYKNILKKKGFVNLKTDSEFLFGYTLGVLESYASKLNYVHHDIYNNIDSPIHARSIQTFYEKSFLKEGKTIKYMKFQLK
jgi:tRNA (guanine-N7-)-methyltransferase